MSAAGGGGSDGGMSAFIATYGNIVIFEALGERAQDDFLVLLLDDSRGRGKDPESRLALTSIRRLAGLEQSGQKIGPGVSGSVVVVDILIGVLSGNFGHGVTNLIAKRRVYDD
jgi:hypothetical protein